MVTSTDARVRTKTDEKVLIVFNYLVMALFTLMCVYPFYYVIISSITDPAIAAKGVYLYPLKLSFDTYARVLGKGDMGLAFLISLARTVLGTLICVVVSSFFAYLVTKKEMTWRKLVYRLVVVTMYLNAGLIPWYITMKLYGLRNNFLLYIIPGAVNAFYLILVKTYIEQIPASLEESASLDGAGIYIKYFQIILPLSKPIIATIAVYCAVSQWNTWIDNYFLVTDTRLQTVQLILYQYLNNAQAIADSMKNLAGASVQTAKITPQSVQNAVIVISVVPIMLAYPFLQKYFVKGIMMGAIKG